MTKLKKTLVKVFSLIGAICFASGFCIDSFRTADGSYVAPISKAKVSRLENVVKTNQEDFYDDSVISKLPDTVLDNQEISVIVTTKEAPTLLRTYLDSGSDLELTDYIASFEGERVLSKLDAEKRKLKTALAKSGLRYNLGADYDTVLSGFEVTIQAKYFDKLNAVLGTTAELIVGEEYEEAQTQVIENKVDVYDTGIFKNTTEYQGDGVVVAVLDTGLDYTHTAFSDKNFTSENPRFTLDVVDGLLEGTQAEKTTSGLTGADVYVGKKVPFAYDYADKDPDVLPINSEHGTHVAGVIAGQDDRITGVAPNAQLAIMKVFSDGATGAKSSWILSAIEDCVKLGVDVINMSLGSSCGFTREEDEERLENAYNSVKEAGISLICAASNDRTASFGSEKNGNLALTSNPDYGTVGSPSTYDAALSVASVDGVKTPYITYNGEIIYFTEATNSAAEEKDFVEDILAPYGDSVMEKEFEYITIPGIGDYTDYAEDREYYAGKIVLVKRGTSTFENKVKVALKEKGAAGIIIYNNVSGTISMAVGDDFGGAVCSLSQEDGEKLAVNKTGKIKISRNQVAGPFMSDFSSWGPTSDLRIKPEITAHGGEIESAIPGNEYDRLSGTSMAAPNQAGATALIREYVKYSGVFGEYSPMATEGLNNVAVTGIVNQLMMSTADIVYNKTGLPYAVRKQGAGLVNISEAIKTQAYMVSYDCFGNLMDDKTKFELGDDKDKEGVYTLKFDLRNISNTALTYDVGSLVISDGVSEIYTGHDDRTVTQEGYLLEGTQTNVTKVTGNGSVSGQRVSVTAGGTVTVTVEIVLSEADKEYIRDSFEYGMYVEGFLTLKAVSGATVDLNAPLLAFFGDWTEAPIFDEEYYDTNKDELNDGLDVADKLMADAYPTKVIGSLYSDYIVTMGSYVFTQNPTSTKIAANKDYISLSNFEDEDLSTVSGISAIWAGLLRNAKEVNVSIVEDATGRQVFSRTERNVRKSHGGGGTIGPSSIDIDLKTADYNLKNNTKYTVTVEAFIDYGEYSKQSNVRNVFTFPLYVDFSAPVITDVTYRTEVDRSTKERKLFADISIYDNHYAMAMQIGQIVEAEPNPDGYKFSMKSFGKYMTPVFSAFNSTSVVTVELTDYISQIKSSLNINGGLSNSFIINTYDYALNAATYEIQVPDEFLSVDFSQDVIELSPNESVLISEYLTTYPTDSWMEMLTITSSNPNVADVVNQTLHAKESGVTVITATGYDKNGEEVYDTVTVKVLGEEDEDYKGNITLNGINKFSITGYKTDKAFYTINSEDRTIGETGNTYPFGDKYELSMYPSEQVTLQYQIDSYYPETERRVEFSSGKPHIAKVDANGQITAMAEGNAKITAKVYFRDKEVLEYSIRISVDVKDPFITTGMYLTAYRGFGGDEPVVIPDDRGITIIQQYAFSSYKYVDKDLNAGDVIDKEDPYLIKPAAIGENTIKHVIIPEGVKTIEESAFENLTALEKVEFPSSLRTIGKNAFKGCNALKDVNLDEVKFINEKAFYQCGLVSIAPKKSSSLQIVAIGDYAFAECQLTSIDLPRTAQSLGIGAFYGNKYMTNAHFNAPKLKIGSYAFAECNSLRAVEINAAVISDHAFYKDCTKDSTPSKLTTVTLGADVAVIGEYAFAGSSVEKFTEYSNQLTTEAGGAIVLRNSELVLVAPAYMGKNKVLETEAISIARGAFSANSKITKVVADNVTHIGPYAFANMTALDSISLKNVQVIDDYAFFSSGLSVTPNLKNVEKIGVRAFSGTKIETLEIPEGAKIGDYAFAACEKLKSVTLQKDVVLGEGVFYAPSVSLTVDVLGVFDAYTDYTYTTINEKGEEVSYTYYRYDRSKTVTYSNLTELIVYENVEIGAYAFAGNFKLKKITFMGDNVRIGEYAFFDATSLNDVDFSCVNSIGDYAFSGSQTLDWQRLNDDEDFYTLKDANNVKWRIAYVYGVVDGEFVATDYALTSYAPVFPNADLTNVTFVGEGAFAGNSGLHTVTIGEKLTEIAPYAFSRCDSLVSITVDEDAIIETIGDYAFYKARVTEFDLSNAMSIGVGAFAKTNLQKVSLKEGVQIKSESFANCKALTEVENLEKATAIGAYAFYATGLTSANLTGATEIGDFAFAKSQVTTVTFGESLLKLGENPFYSCQIATYAKEIETELKNGKKIFETVETYAISDKVKVINGVLYQIVPNGGLELVSYPASNTIETYIVEEGTVRVSARAFNDALLKNVTLPLSLKSLGDKAFYGCQNLSVVVFKSYNAPILEEEFDESHLSYENFPMTGELAGYVGLGIVDYYMWNVGSTYSAFFFGANFVDYIGYVTEKLVMVSPSNGQNYDTFIFSQYFGTKVSGEVAIMDETLAVIDKISLIPEIITLSSESVIVDARKAYNAITSLEQKALISNADKLDKAEKMLANLKSQPNPDTPPPQVDDTNVIEDNIVGIIIAVVAVLAFGAIGVIVLKKSTFAKKTDKTQEKSEEINKENVDEE